MKKKQSMLKKAAAGILALLLFATAGFVVYNESSRTLNGEAVSVSLAENGLLVSYGEKGWLIGPDETRWKQAGRLVENRPGCLPLPLALLRAAQQLGKQIGGSG